MTTTIDNLKKDLKDTATDASDAASGLGSRIADYAKTNVAEPLSKAASDAGDAISEGYREGKAALKSKTEGASAWIANNPFAAVAIGVAAGAIVGALTRGK